MAWQSPIDTFNPLSLMSPLMVVVSSFRSIVPELSLSIISKSRGISCQPFAIASCSSVRLSFCFRSSSSSSSSCKLADSSRKKSTMSLSCDPLARENLPKKAPNSTISSFLSAFTSEASIMLRISARVICISAATRYLRTATESSWRLIRSSLFVSHFINSSGMRFHALPLRSATRSGNDCVLVPPLDSPWSASDEASASSGTPTSNATVLRNEPNAFLSSPFSLAAISDRIPLTSNMV
mmetsp:Transcript_5199/g.11304  ORF Transcript_5199/g.11304 Transcript_5199/m.11304 type:complete len:239 (-) Transcript_5199:263-979(-)